MQPGSVTDWLAKFSKRHGLPHINPHAFRHAMASMLYFNGVDSVSISKRLGHAQVSTTANIYAHVMEVPSRFMRKIVCRLRLSEVSRQRRCRPELPPNASYSCISCSPTGCPPRGGASRRSASGRNFHQGTSPPPASAGGSPGSAARSRCWYGCASSVRWENRSRSASPQCHARGGLTLTVNRTSSLL